ncbi:MAG: 50S ribosomal protein L10 [Anaerolineales bacterium]
MAISREKKEELVEEYREIIERSRGLIMTGYSGLTVRDTEELRSKMREVGGEFHIVKNSLIELAMEQAGLPVPEGSLEGTTAIGFADQDIPTVAKAIVELAKDRKVLEIKAGVIEGSIYQPSRVEKLADLPPLPIVQGQLLGLLQTPAGRMVNTLAGSVRQIVNVVKAYSEQESAEAGA